MGGSTNWIKALMGLKKNTDHRGKGQKIKKWKFWRNSSSGVSGGDRILESAASDTLSCVLDHGHGHGRSVAIANTDNVVMSSEECAAIRIQTTFRAFLAKRALRALKAIVRIQALFRGRLVRKKAAITLKCMESMVRAQARVRAQCSQLSQEGKSLSEKSKRAEIGWCNSPGSAEQVKSKLQLRQEAALKRERAAAYALAQQKQLTLKPRKASSLNERHKSGDSEETNWLEKWMATKKYWKEPNTASPVAEKYQHCYTPVRYSTSSYEYGNTRLSRNRNILTKISSSSDPSLDLFHDESTASNSSSISTSETPGSNNTSAEGYGYSNTKNKPSYMTATASQKAKQRGSPSHSVNNMQQHRSFDNASFYCKSSPVSESVHRRSADLYPPVLLGKHNRFRRQQH